MALLQVLAQAGRCFSASIFPLLTVLMSCVLPNMHANWGVREGRGQRASLYFGVY